MQIGAYLVEDTLEVVESTGGSATARLARHAHTGALYYLTLFTPTSEASRQAWIARIKTLRSIDSPFLLPIKGGGALDDGSLYVTTPYYPPLLATAGALSVGGTMRVSRQVSAALDALHEAGLMHGALSEQHLVSVDEQSVALRGVELLAHGGEPDDDLRAYARLLHLALTNQPLKDDAISTRVPRPLARVLRNMLRTNSPYNTAGLAHDALTGAVSAMSRDRRLVQGTSTQSGGVRRLLPLGILAAVLLSGVAAVAIWRASVASGPLPSVLALPTSGPATATSAATFTPTTPITDTAIAVVLNPTATPTEPELLTETATAVPPTETPEPSATYTPSDTPLPPTDTATPVPPTPTLTETPRPAALVTATPLPTFTPSVTPVPPTETATLIPLSPTPAASATLSLPTPPPPPASDLLTNPCVALVGDSVTAGTGVYEIPATGYAFIQAIPVSEFVEQALQSAGFEGIKGVDRGAPNTGISTTNHPSYFVTAQYRSLLQDNCRYTIIMPWVNDISPAQPADQAALRHASVLTDLISTIVASSPYSRVLVLNYYQPVVSPFAARTWAFGFTPDDIDLYNRAISDACATGTLSTLPQVVCIDINGLFQDMGEEHVIRYTSQDQLYALLKEPPAGNSAALLNAYFNANPAGQILGDGVHLSPRGKTRLASFLAQHIRALPPMSNLNEWLKPTG